MSDSEPKVSPKYWSQHLSSEQVLEALLELHRVLNELLGHYDLIAYYGFSANLHADLCYLPMRTDTERLQWFIKHSLDPKIILPGKSDLLIDTHDKRLEINFSHESYIHLSGTDEDLLNKFMKSEPYCRINWVIEVPRKITKT